MPNGVKKENLPSKVCVVCQRPFTWRKKWERVWDEVTTCSKSCNSKRRAQSNEANRLQRKEIASEIVNGTSTSSSSNMLETNEASIALMVGSDCGVLPFETDTDGTIDEVDALLSTISMGSVNDDSKSTISEDSDATSQQMIEDPKAARKAAKKRAKVERRAKREGRLNHGQKDCDVCNKSVDLLIRCTIDESKQWKMVCGRCWKDVSGGVVDGDANHPHYRYGGLWKNRAKRS